VDAILGATRALLDERGPDGLTTNHIAERAGISIGSLYRYFPDKAAVYAAIYEQDTRREAEDLSEQDWLVETAGLAEALVALIDFQLDRHRRLVERGGAFYKESHHAFSLSDALGRDDVTRRIRDVLARHRGEVRVADLEEAAYLLVRGLSAVVRRVTEERPDKLESRAFRRELVDLTLLYVTGEAGEDDG
jgi:AcrR family transcriptional regulator